MNITENKFNPENVVADPTPKYDPNKGYGWEPGSTFVFSGEEFGVILNSIRSILRSPEAQKIMLAMKADEAVEKALSRAVEAGVAKEQEYKK